MGKILVLSGGITFDTYSPVTEIAASLSISGNKTVFITCRNDVTKVNQDLLNLGCADIYVHKCDDDLVEVYGIIKSLANSGSGVDLIVVDGARYPWLQSVDFMAGISRISREKDISFVLTCCEKTSVSSNHDGSKISSALSYQTSMRVRVIEDGLYLSKDKGGNPDRHVSIDEIVEMMKGDAYE